MWPVSIYMPVTQDVEVPTASEPIVTAIRCSGAS